MASYASETAADLDADYKKFFEDFYRLSDTTPADGGTSEAYADQFTDDAALIMGSSRSKGRQGTFDLLLHPLINPFCDLADHRHRNHQASQWHVGQCRHTKTHAAQNILAWAQIQRGYALWRSRLYHERRVQRQEGVGCESCANKGGREGEDGLLSSVFDIDCLGRMHMTTPITAGPVAKGECRHRCLQLYISYSCRFKISVSSI